MFVLHFSVFQCSFFLFYFLRCFEGHLKGSQMLQLRHSVCWFLLLLRPLCLFSVFSVSFHIHLVWFHLACKLYSVMFCLFLVCLVPYLSFLVWSVLLFILSILSSIYVIFILSLFCNLYLGYIYTLFILSLFCYLFCLSC